MHQLHYRYVLVLLTLLLSCPIEFTLANEKIESPTDHKEGQKVDKLKVMQPVLTPEQEEKALDQEKIPEFLFRETLASDVVGARPNEGKGPTYVKVGFYVFDISYIDDAKQTFTGRIRVVLRWHDPRLAGHDKEIRKVKLEEIWNPLTGINNSRSVQTEYEDFAFVDQDGYVTNAWRVSGTFTVPLNLRDFPLDSHLIQIFLRSYFSPNDVQFLIDEKLTGWADTLSIPDWRVSDGRAVINNYFYKEQNREQTQLVFSFKISRKIGFYLWKTLIPMVFIVIMSWGVFWISPLKLEAQIALSATAFLTLFAFQFAIASLLPRINYLTRLDQFTMMCYLLVFLSLIESILTSYFVYGERTRQALVMDRICRFLFPLAFLFGTVYTMYL